MFKDIAFSLLFLHCCPSSLSFQISLYRVWTPVAHEHKEEQNENRAKVKEIKMHGYLAFTLSLNLKF